MSFAEAVFLLALPAGFGLLLVAIAAPLERTARGRRLTEWLLERIA